MTYSQLSNGHLIPSILPIGAMVQTQWGGREVVAHIFIPLLATSQPTTAWGEAV